MSRIITCERVSDGHLDKICDQIVDEILMYEVGNDKNARVAVECMLKGNRLVIGGEITSALERFRFSAQAMSLTGSGKSGSAVHTKT